MRISFSPQRRDDALTVSKQGDMLIINGDELDLSMLTDGSSIDMPEGSDDGLHPLIAPTSIKRVDGQIYIALFLPIPAGCNDPWMCFPDPIEVTEDGPVDIPFATHSEMVETPVEGGINLVTTTYRWHRKPEVETVFIPDPEPEKDVE